jgi:hypothetical protein
VQPKLLPHRLSFNRHSNCSTQAAQSESPSHLAIVDIQPSATLLPHSSLQPRAIYNRVFSADYTTFGDHSFYRPASVDTVITDRRDGNTGEALMQNCSAFNNAMLPLSINPSEDPNTLPIARDSIMASSNNVDDIADTRDTDGQAGTSMRVSTPFLLPSYISSASISPSPPASTPSPLAEHEPIWQEGSPQSLYARRMQRLDYLHPEVQKHIARIIWLGDHFLREDVGTFLGLVCRRWSQTDPGYHPVPSSFIGNDSRMQSLFRRYYLAEAFRRSSVTDRLKFRFLRILLYHDFEELCINIQDDLERYRPLSGGQDAASVATDKFIDGFSRAYGEGVHTRTDDQRRQSFRRHKAIGRRWSIVASHLGLGIFLTCSPELEAYMYDFYKPPIYACLTYLAMTATFLIERSQLSLRIYAMYILEEVN